MVRDLVVRSDGDLTVRREYRDDPALRERQRDRGQGLDLSGEQIGARYARAGFSGVRHRV